MNLRSGRCVANKFPPPKQNPVIDQKAAAKSKEIYRLNESLEQESFRKQLIDVLSAPYQSQKLVTPSASYVFVTFNNGYFNTGTLVQDEHGQPYFIDKKSHEIQKQNCIDALQNITLEYTIEFHWEKESGVLVLSCKPKDLTEFNGEKIILSSACCCVFRKE